MSQGEADDKPPDLHAQALAVGEIAEWLANIEDNPSTTWPEFCRWRKGITAAAKTLFWLAENAELVREAHAMRKRRG